jgi:hypothetical protein
MCQEKSGNPAGDEQVNPTDNEQVNSTDALDRQIMEGWILKKTSKFALTPRANPTIFLIYSYNASVVVG